MGYQALLFCPDEKTARTVTQVLSELDFNVISCTEPFAAVKKFMGERFDAVVVDCDNEQNATLLFKSARNAPNNQSALAVAVVEGQAGVAKAFRIGANLVLTKPINVEQAKGTLRVARGLLRKNETAKPASLSASPAIKSATPPPAPARPAPLAPVSAMSNVQPLAPIEPLAPAPIVFTPKPVQQPSISASAPFEIGEASAKRVQAASDSMASLPTAPPAQGSAPKIVPVASSPAIAERTTEPRIAERRGSAGFAASAPAPARESKAGAVVDNEPSTVISPPADEPAKTDISEKTSSLDTSAAAAGLTFGGAAIGDSKSAGGSKKMLVALVAMVLVAAGGYAAWTQWGHSDANQSAPAHLAAQPTMAPVTVPQTTASAPSTPVIASPASDNQKPALQAIAASPTARPNKIVTADLSKPPASTVTANKIPATNVAPPPMIIKSDRSQTAGKSPATVDAPALSVTDIAQGNAAALPDLMGPNSAPTPVLQRMMVSQGVSRGLLVKQVRPVYPRTALQMHIEGTVQLLATVSKEGNISEVKVLSGDNQLARAAMDAVKEWKYKPYLLNGEPVDIQTQITVNFKLPR